jgi:hypothetical protein
MEIDTKKEPKIGKIKDQLMDTMYHPGEKIEWMENEIGKMRHGFNEVVRECQVTMNMITDTLTDNVKDRLTEVEDALASVTLKLKYQDDIITLLK